MQATHHLFLQRVCMNVWSNEPTDLMAGGKQGWNLTVQVQTMMKTQENRCNTAAGRQCRAEVKGWVGDQELQETALCHQVPRPFAVEGGCWNGHSEQTAESQCF